MKFLIDECVGPTVAQWLVQNNYNENRILITSDKDFGEMIFKRKQPHCGILLLRLSDERPTNKIHVLKNILKNYINDLPNNFVVATEKAIRIIKPTLH